MKRYPVLLISILLILLGTMATAEAKTYTEAEIVAKLDALESLLVGKYFTVNGKSCTSSYVPKHGCDNCNMTNVIKSDYFTALMDYQPVGSKSFSHYRPDNQGIVKGESCAGFANYIGWYLFTEDPSEDVIFWSVYEGKCDKTLMQYARPGDIIGFAPHHSGIVLEVTETAITVLDCNNKASGNCLIQRVTYKYASDTSRRVVINRATNYPYTYTVKNAKSITQSEVESKLTAFYSRVTERNTKKGYAQCFTTTTTAACTTPHVGTHSCSKCKMENVINSTSFRVMLNYKPIVSGLTFQHQRPDGTITGGGSDAGLANWLGWYLFSGQRDYKVEWETIEGFVDLETMYLARPGDIFGIEGHSGIVYEITSTYVSVLECDNRVNGNCAIKVNQYAYADFAATPVVINRATNYVVDPQPDDLVPPISFNAHDYMDNPWIAERINSFVRKYPLGTAYNGSFDGQKTHIAYAYESFNHIFGYTLSSVGYNLLVKGSSVADLRDKMELYDVCPGTNIWIKSSDSSVNKLMVLLRRTSSGIDVLLSDKTDSNRIKCVFYTWSEMESWISSGAAALYFESPSIKTGSKNVDGDIVPATAYFPQINYEIILDGLWTMADFGFVVDSYEGRDQINIDRVTISNPDVLYPYMEGDLLVVYCKAIGDSTLTIHTNFGKTATAHIAVRCDCFFNEYPICWTFNPATNVVSGVCGMCGRDHGTWSFSGASVLNGVKTIEADAFNGADLTDVYLPESGVTVGDRAFASIPGLRTVRFTGNVTLGDDVFGGSASVVLILDPGSNLIEWAKTHNIAYALSDGSKPYSTDAPVAPAAQVQPVPPVQTAPENRKTLNK